MWERSSLVIRCVLAAALAHLGVHLLLSPASSLVGFPASSADYLNLSTTALAWSWSTVRPLSQLLTQVLSVWGQGQFYLALNVLTAAYVGLVLAFLCLLLDSRPSFPLLAAGAVAALAFEGTVDRYLYTGMIANLSSGVLGVAALIVLWTGITSGPGRRLAVGAALAGAALLAKEDLLLPLLAACACWGWTEPDPAARRRARIALALLVATGCLWLTLCAGPLGSYHRSDLHPTSLMWTASRLLTVTPGATLASVCFLGAAVVVFRSHDPRRRAQLLLLLAVVFALVLPCAARPTAVYAYFAADWVPWQLGLLPALGAALAPAGGRRRAALALVAAAAAAMLWVSRPGRAESLAGYEERTERSRATISLLERMRPALASERRVGIAGVSYTNPWRANDGRYLASRLDLAKEWIVFAGEEYIAGLEAFGVPLRSGRITTRPARELPELGELALVLLRADGTGTLCRSPGMNGPLKPRIEVSFGDEPCRSRRSRVSWQVDDRPVVIWERSPRERVLAVGEGSGSALVEGLADGALLVIEHTLASGERGCLALTIVSLKRPGCS